MIAGPRLGECAVALADSAVHLQSTSENKIFCTHERMARYFSNLSFGMPSVSAFRARLS